MTTLGRLARLNLADRTVGQQATSRSKAGLSINSKQIACRLSIDFKQIACIGKSKEQYASRTPGDQREAATPRHQL
jgi:hypothetical protein